MSCGCRIRAMVSEVPLMYGTVAIVTVVGLVFVELGPLSEIKPRLTIKLTRQTLLYLRIC